MANPQTEESVPLDCQLARHLNLRPKVDCQYTWEHWSGDNELFYWARINSSGQDIRGWCKGIWDNIKAECNKKADCPSDASDHPECFNNTIDARLMATPSTASRQH